MKTKTIAAWIVATGFLTAGAFAESSLATSPATPAASEAPAPAPDRVTAAPQSPSAGDPADVAAVPGPTAQQIAQLKLEFSATYRADDELAKKVAERVLADARAFLEKPESPTIVYSQPPSPVFTYDENAPAHWDPSITFRFDWGRSRRG